MQRKIQQFRSSKKRVVGVVVAAILCGAFFIFRNYSGAPWQTASLAVTVAAREERADQIVEATKSAVEQAGLQFAALEKAFKDRLERLEAGANFAVEKELKDRVVRLEDEVIGLKSQLTQDTIAKDKEQLPGPPPGGEEDTLEIVKAVPVKRSGVGNADPERAEAVKRALLHSWNGYEKFSWGRDDLIPIGKSGRDWLHQAGTMIDALDTLWIMGFKDEFQRARDYIAKMSFPVGARISVFETTIRTVGGLISAYELSGDKIFLDKAVEMGDLLLPAFQTSSGVLCNFVALGNGGGGCGATYIAEAGTVQLEFLALSKHTGNPKYEQAAMKFYDVIRRSQPQPPGLYPSAIDTNSGGFSSAFVSLGAFEDSFFEYLVKVWLLRGQKDDWMKKLYKESYDAILEHIYRKSQSGLWFVPSYESGRIGTSMEHLACFTGGMYALSSKYETSSERYMEVAANLAETCYIMANTTKTGLSGEICQLNDRTHITCTDTRNMLRPETIETLFYLWRRTHDPKYREWGWTMFKAFQKYAFVKDGGFVGVERVDELPPAFIDLQESFWLAETLKYFFLLFSDDSLLSLDEIVFTTEAHPFRIFK